MQNLKATIEELITKQQQSSIFIPKYSSTGGDGDGDDGDDSRGNTNDKERRQKYNLRSDVSKQMYISTGAGGSGDPDDGDNGNNAALSQSIDGIGLAITNAVASLGEVIKSPNLPTIQIPPANPPVINVSPQAPIINVPDTLKIEFEDKGRVGEKIDELKNTLKDNMMKSSFESKMTIPEKITVHIEKDPTSDSTMTANNLALQEMSKNIQMSDKMRQQNANALEKLSLKLEDIKVQQQQQQPSFSFSNQFDDFKKMVESQVEMIQTSSNITINDMRQAFQDVTKSYNNLIDNAINIQFKKLGEFYAKKTDMDQRLNEELKSTPSSNASQPNNNITVNINMDEVIKESQDQHKLISNEILSMIHDDGFKSKVSTAQTNEATNLKSISEVLTTMAKSMHDLMANMINFKQQQTCEKDFTMVTIKDMMTNVIEEHRKVIEKLIQRSDVKVITPPKSPLKSEIYAFRDEQIKDITDTLKELKKDKKETQKQIQNMIFEQQTRRKEQDLLYDKLRTLKTNLNNDNSISSSAEQSILNKNIEMICQ